MQTRMGLGLGLGMTRGGGGASFNFYVDSVNGSDSNTGTSAAQAFATLSAAETAALAYGNNVSIGLACGSHWRETLDLTSLSGVKVWGYGTSALPKIDCADVALNADFSLAPSQTKTYQITWTHELPAAIGKDKLRVWLDGARLKWVSSIANCEAEAGTFFVSNASISNPATIYVHPTGDTNPTTDGKLYEIVRRGAAVTVGDDYDVRRIHTTRNGNHDGSFKPGINGYGYKILSTDGVVHNQWVGVGGTHEECVVYDCEPSEWRGLNTTLFISYRGAGSANTTTFRRCYAVNTATNSVTNADGIYGHTAGGANRLAKVRIEDYYFKGGGSSTAAAFADTDALEVVGAFVRFNSGRATACGGFAAATGSNTIDDITVINGARVFPFGNSLTVRNARLFFNGSVSGGAIWVSNADIQNSTFAFATAVGEGNSAVFNSSINGATFRNNVIQEPGFYAINGATGAIDSDLNVIRSSRSATRGYYFLSSVQKTWAAWLTDSGEDANSAFQAPNATALVTDPANNDWTFTSTVVDEGGRTSGSRLSIAEPDWTALEAAWGAGFLGIDGTGL